MVVYVLWFTFSEKWSVYWLFDHTNSSVLYRNCKMKFSKNKFLHSFIRLIVMNIYILCYVVLLQKLKFFCIIGFKMFLSFYLKTQPRRDKINKNVLIYYMWDNQAPTVKKFRKDGNYSAGHKFLSLWKMKFNIYFANGYSFQSMDVNQILG